MNCLLWRRRLSNRWTTTTTTTILVRVSFRAVESKCGRWRPVRWGMYPTCFLVYREWLLVVWGEMRLRLATIGFLLVLELYLLYSRGWPIFKVRELLLNGFYSNLIRNKYTCLFITIKWFLNYYNIFLTLWSISF